MKLPSYKKRHTAPTGRVVRAATLDEQSLAAVCRTLIHYSQQAMGACSSSPTSLANQELLHIPWLDEMRSQRFKLHLFLIKQCAIHSRLSKWVFEMFEAQIGFLVYELGDWQTDPAPNAPRLGQTHLNQLFLVR